MRTSRAGRALALAVLSSCSSPDGGTGPATVTVNGAVHDYFTNAAVSGASVEVDGAAGVVATTSAGGSYLAQGISSTSALVLVASKTGHRLTRNVGVAATASIVTVDLRIVASADVQRQYAAVGLSTTAGTAVVFVELVDATGTPRTGVPAADITLVGAGQSPVGTGPFFFSASGDIVPPSDLSQSTAYAGRARAAFLDVPTGSHTLRIALTGETLSVPVIASAGGATLVEL